jgi:excisionase family DNA binding protein
VTVWMNLETAARYACVSVPTLRREIKAGRLRAFRVGGRKAIRLRQSDLDEWLTGQRTEVSLNLGSRS